LGTLNAGSHNLSVSYQGDGNFAPQSTTGTLVVNAADTSVSIAAPQVTYNRDATVTVTVGSGTAPTPTGSVTLTVDGGSPQTAMVSGAQAIFTVSSAAAGNHSLSASFTPDSTNYNASSQTGVTLQVNATQTKTAIVAPTFTYNEPGTVTVTASNQSGTTAVPPGSITLTRDGGNAQAATLVNGPATVTARAPAAT